LDHANDTGIVPQDIGLDLEDTSAQIQHVFGLKPFLIRIIVRFLRILSRNIEKSGITPLKRKKREPPFSGVLVFALNGSPRHTPQRPFFEVEFPISLYRVLKGAWKIGDPDRPHSTSSWPLKTLPTATARSFKH